MKIIYHEVSGFGQDLLDMLAMIAQLMDDEKPFTMRGFHNVMRDIREKSFIIEKDAAKFGKEYFAGDDDDLR